MEQSYIVLIILAIMIAGFILNKWSYGLTTMICCALLALTGVLPISEAFGGFCNKTLIMIACIFVISTGNSPDFLCADCILCTDDGSNYYDCTYDYAAGNSEFR